MIGIPFSANIRSLPQPNSSETKTPGRDPLRHNIHRRHHVTPPPHHVAVIAQASIIEQLPLVSSIFPTSPEQLYTSTRTSVFVNAGPETSEEPSRSKLSQPKVEYVRSGFRNPWPSWHKPALGEVWNGLRWGKEGSFVAEGEVVDPKALSDDDEEQVNSNEKREGLQQSLTPDIKSESLSSSLDGPGADLEIIEPIFAKEGLDGVVQATWLGHASVLLELPSLPGNPNTRPLRILYDPIFSMRCSPTQYFGPLRSYSPPCTIASLPEIDIILISHSHYDHLDYDSIVQLWHANRDHLQFYVPLGDREWFLSLDIGIGEDRVNELDWWDEAWLDQKSDGGGGKVEENNMLRIICTPAQHGSGRYAIDASRSLWCSWTLEYIVKGNKYRIFFGGDTGFQFHSPDSSDSQSFPTCPAFAEVARYIGKPDLSFLPISVGASFNFVKSYDWLGIVPQLDHGLTAANHLTPYDAVRVGKIMRGFDEADQQASSSTRNIEGQGVVVAIHWGTFVTGLEEVRGSMHDLFEACEKQGVKYVRSLDQRQSQAQQAQDKSPLLVACLDHGQSVYLNLQRT